MSAAQQDRQSAGIVDKTKAPAAQMPSTNNGDINNPVVIRSID